MKGRNKAKPTTTGPVFLQPIVAISKKQDALAILLIIAVNAVVYYNSLYGDFCFDDHLAIANNGDSNGGNDVTVFVQFLILNILSALLLCNITC